MRLKFAEEFGIPPQAVIHTPLKWWYRWLTWQAAKSTQEAYASRDAYKDKDGSINWAEWAGKHPDLSKRLKWALEADDE